MIRKNKTFIEWMYFIKSVHYASKKTSFLTNVKNEIKCQSQQK